MECNIYGTVVFTITADSDSYDVEIYSNIDSKHKSYIVMAENNSFDVVALTAEGVASKVTGTVVVIFVTAEESSS